METSPSSSFSSYTTSSSSSSFASELFGSNKYQSSSTGTFGSIFAPSSKVLGRESVPPQAVDKKQESSNDAWNNNAVVPDDRPRNAESQSMQNKDMSCIYQDQRVQPCHLCSSIYYGGQDIYSHEENNQGSGLNPPVNKDCGEDDLGSASRGDWWQGSLYY